MYSATWPKEVRQLADDFLGENFIHATIGSMKLSANKKILPIVDVCTTFEKVYMKKILHKLILISKLLCNYIFINHIFITT